MSWRRRGLARSDEGAASLEFVIVFPFLVVLFVGTLQIGMLFLANAGLQQAVEAGARYATIYPRPSTEQIAARVRESGYGMRASGIEEPTITYGTTADSPYADISMRYSLRLNFIFFQSRPIALEHTRRAYQS